MHFPQDKFEDTSENSIDYLSQFCNLISCSSSYMEKEESTRIPDCRSKVAKSMRKTGYCTTVPFPFVIKDEALMSNLANLCLEILYLHLCFIARTNFKASLV